MGEATGPRPILFARSRPQGGRGMKIAAMAAGAVGAYFGGRMQAGGHDVAYIARRAHLDALRKDGLKIESVHGDLHLPKVNATPDPDGGGPVDLVPFAVQ